MRSAIQAFDGRYRWLSNFSPAEVVFEGLTYPTVEHAYQAAKTHASKRAPFLTGTPGQAKRLGRGVELRRDWEQVKVQVMRQLLAEKFAAGSALAEMLLATGDADLIEGNYWNDTFWGVCRGKGENTLGKLLMERREALFAGAFADLA